MQITRRIFPAAAISGLAAFKAVAYQDKTAEARSFADSIYKLFDKGDFRGMYKRFHSTMRSQMSEDQWVEMVTKVASQTGKVQERKFRSKEQAWGAYKFVFDSQYAAGRATDEITVAEEESEFRLAAIWVKPSM